MRVRWGSAVIVVALAATGVAACSSGGGTAANPAASAVSPVPVQTTDPAGANFSYAPPSDLGPGSNVTVDMSSPSPNTVETTQAAVPEQATYACKGSAPDGVDITYGPNGSNHSASSLPFSHTEPLTQGAQYYVTSAQLQGSGSVSCTTTVQTDNLDGTADDVTNTGSADGGYNIASAQVCGGINGWEKC